MLSTPVQTTGGPVIGIEKNGVRAFKGLPFAKSRRFGRARPPEPWTEVRQCIEYGPYAPQQAHLGCCDEAACLTLNIWTPSFVSSPLPVLFWIHGGAFVTGAGADYDGAFLAAHGPAVIVTINYRLGPLGFLQLHRYGGALNEANNLAITDALAALDWVRSNIANFGGDPAWLTLFGQSAGASMVLALATLPQAKDKFRGAIAFSAPGRGIIPAEHADEVASRLLAEVKCDREPGAIASISLPQLFAATDVVARRLAEESPLGTVFGPVLDGPVIPRDPREAVADGSIRHVPLWLGSCRDEMTMFMQAVPQASMIRVTERQIRSSFGDEGWDRLLACYRATARTDENPLEALLSDAFWHRPLADIGRRQNAAGGSVWVSRFDYSPRLEPFLSQGPTHGADNACLWAHLPEFLERPILRRKGGPMALADIGVAARLQAAVLRFVATGAPDEPDVWPSFDARSESFVTLDRQVRIAHLNRGERSRLWAEVEDGAGRVTTEQKNDVR